MLGKREAMRIKSDTLNILNTFVAQCSDFPPFFGRGGLGGGGKPWKGSQKILYGCMPILEGKRRHP